MSSEEHMEVVYYSQYFLPSQIWTSSTERSWSKEISCVILQYFKGALRKYHCDCDFSIVDKGAVYVGIKLET